MNNVLYAKFQRASKLGRHRSFVVSTDRATIDEDKPPRQNRPEDSESDANKPEQGSAFFRINQEIFDTFVAYYDLAPTIIGIARAWPNVIIEDEIKKKFKSYGNLLEETETHEIYSINEGNYPTLKQDIRKIHASSTVAAGVDRFFVMGLISLYDQFIYNLASAVIDSRPHIVFNSEKSFTLKDVSSCSSVDEIKAMIIESELDALLRSSHEDQLKWFSDKLDMKIDPEPELKARFIELCERRNLFAHNGGRVSRHYLRKVRFADESLRPSIGATLGVGKKYFESAVETIIEIAVQLVYVVWQKAGKETSGGAAKSLINLTFSLICDSKYALAIRILDFLLNVKPINMDDRTRKTHLINHANAMKLLGKDEYLTLVDKEDWSGATIDFLLCIAALREDVETFTDLMAKAVKSEVINKKDIREWPVFIHVRADQRIAKKFEELFSEPLLEMRSSNNETFSPSPQA